MKNESKTKAQLITELEGTKAREEMLNTIFENTPMVLALVNEAGKVENINNKGVQFSGKKKKDILGLLGGEVFNCFHSFNGEGCSRNPVCSDCAVRTRVEKTFKTKMPIIEEEGRMTFVVGGETADFDLLITTVPVFLEGENRVLLSIADMTMHYQIKIELAKHREQLEELVAERTKELEKRNEELESIHKNVIGREFRIKELRDQVKELKERLGE